MTEIAPCKRSREDGVRVGAMSAVYSKIVLQEGTDVREIRGDHEPAWSGSVPCRARNTCGYHACPGSQLDNTERFIEIIHKGWVKIKCVAFDVGTQRVRNFPVQRGCRGRVGVILEGKRDEVFTKPCLRCHI